MAGVWYQCKEEDPGGGGESGVHNNFKKSCNNEIDDNNVTGKGNDGEDDDHEKIKHYSLLKSNNFFKKMESINTISDEHEDIELNHNYCQNSLSSVPESFSSSSLSAMDYFDQTLFVKRKRVVVLKTKVEVHPIPSKYSSNGTNSVIHNCDTPPMIHLNLPNNSNRISPSSSPPIISSNNIIDHQLDTICTIEDELKDNLPGYVGSTKWSEIPEFQERDDKKSCSRSNSYLSSNSTIMGPEKEQVMGERMRNIVAQFRARAETIRQKLGQSPSPDDNEKEFQSTQSLSSSSSFNNDSSDPIQIGHNVFYENFDSSRYASKSTINYGEMNNLRLFGNLKRKMEYVDPRGIINIVWLSFQALVFLYNAWVIPLRAIYPLETLYFFYFFDYFGDLIYLVDVIYFKRRLLFMQNGFWVKQKARLRHHYIREGYFRYDIFALLPLDIIFLVMGFRSRYSVLLRLPRLIKIYSYREFITRLDSMLAKPYFLRIFKTVNNMLYLIHLNACAYYLFSDVIGIGSNNFVYDGDGNAYIRCFYFATKTATSIGKNKKPESVPEILFMTASWLMGVFVFAILIGDIRDIVGTARRNIMSFQRQMDAVNTYMNDNKVEGNIRSKVKMWMNYTWEQQKTFDENKILDFLPLKLRTDIAMRVHYKTLSKVKLFRNCDPGLLKDLVVLLRPIIYLDGDFICRKDDKGTEMFIIQTGQVQVMSANDNKRVLVTLSQGSVFGEIALLGVGGMNRRTADVVSRGFSTLFVLKKPDLEQVLKDYPDAQRILNARAKRLMKENQARHLQAAANSKSDFDEEANKVLFSHSRKISAYDPKRDPALLEAVMSIIPKAGNFSSFRRRLQKGVEERDRRRSSNTSGYFFARSLSDQDIEMNFYTATSARFSNRGYFSQDESLMKLSQQRTSCSSNNSTPYSLMSSYSQLNQDEQDENNDKVNCLNFNTDESSVNSDDDNYNDKYISI